MALLAAFLLRGRGAEEPGPAGPAPGQELAPESVTEPITGPITGPVLTQEERFAAVYREFQALVAELLGEGPLGAGVNFTRLQWGGRSAAHLEDRAVSGSRFMSSSPFAVQLNGQGKCLESLRWTMASLRFHQDEVGMKSVRRNLFGAIEAAVEGATSLRRWRTALRMADLLEATQFDEFWDDHARIPILAGLLRAQAYSDAGIRDRAMDELRAARGALQALQAEHPDQVRKGVAKKYLFISSRLALARGDGAALAGLQGELESFQGLGLDLGEVPARLQMHLGIHALDRYRSAGEPGLAVAAQGHLERALTDPNLSELERQEVEVGQVELMALRDAPGDAARGLEELRAGLSSRPRFPRIELVLGSLGVRLAGLAGSGLSLAEEGAGLQAAFDSMLERWAKGTGRKAGTGFLWSSDRVEALALLCAAHLGAGESGGERALEQLLQVERASTLAQALAASPPSLERIDAALLGAGAGLLVLLPSARGGWVVALERGAPPRWLPHKAGPAARARLARWSNLVGRSPGRLASDAARQARAKDLAGLEEGLEEVLWPSAISEWILTRSSLYLVHGDFLGNLPLDALPVRGQRLGTRMPVAYLPSVVAGVALAERAAGAVERAPSLALLSASEPSAADVAEHDLDALRFGEGQALGLLEPFERSRWFAHVSDAEEVLAGVREGGFGWLQVLAHGIQDLDRERPSVVVLEGGGRLGGREAEAMAAPPGLFFAACGAGLGPVRSGDAVSSSLAGTFLQQGSRVVVIPIASVPYEAALVLMGEFNRELARGASASEALHRARLRLTGPGGPAQGEGRPWADPAYWAGFQVIGIGHRRK